MAYEELSGVAQEVTADNVYLTLQEQLGVTEDVARDLALVQVACPEPGEGRQTSLADFMTSSHGADKAESIIADVKEELADGASVEKALKRALGMAAVMNRETGRLVRVPDDTGELKKK